MRLINCTTGRLESETDWVGGVPPLYAILSHTWAQSHEPKEVTYQDYIAGKSTTSSSNWAKLEHAIEITKDSRYNLNYIWIDTCCIDKTSSAELSEAINSMFQWYAEAVVCYAYIADFTKAIDSCEEYDDECWATQLKKCRWFERGWTLQELIAPKRVEFFDSTWCYLGSRQSLCSTISTITNIDEQVLADIHPSQSAGYIHRKLFALPVAKRMSWAAKRTTTREEDAAYSLLGIFDINMPLLYGEGPRAFVRLQEEILRSCNDLTLFAWESASSEPGPNMTKEQRGILAESLREFSRCGDISFRGNRTTNPEFSLCNKGLRMVVSYDDRYPSLFMDLHCQRGPKFQPRSLGLELQYSKTHQYVRINHEYLTTNINQLEELKMTLVPIIDVLGVPLLDNIRQQTVRVPTTIYIAVTRERLQSALLSKGPISKRLVVVGASGRSDARAIGTSHESLWCSKLNAFDITQHPFFAGYVLLQHFCRHSHRTSKFLVGVVIKGHHNWTCIAEPNTALYAAALRRDWDKMVELGTRYQRIRIPSQVGEWRGCELRVTCETPTLPDCEAVGLELRYVTISRQSYGHHEKDVGLIGAALLTAGHFFSSQSSKHF